MKRVRRYVAQARQRRGSKRLLDAAMLPLAGLVAMVCVQLAILSANEELTLAAAAPKVWMAISFTGLIAVFTTWLQK